MKSFLAKLLGISLNLLNWLLPILRDQAANALERLLPLALTIVTELAKSNSLGNAEKRATALARLRNEATIEGIECGTNILNLAIEAAVANMKATTK